MPLKLKSRAIYAKSIALAMRDATSAALRVARVLREELKAVDALIEYGYSELEALYIVQCLRT